MFVRASTLVLAIAASVIAAPSGTDTTKSQCDVGEMQCCNSVVTSSIAQQLGINVPIAGLVGLTCTSIIPIGLGSGGECNQSPVCCTDVSQNGLVNLGCSPVAVNA